ncbi:MAG: glycosyltransferase [Eubacteriales bacterium]|nr:glycosyltransferase [Eubacteriales bacterium]
MISVAMAVYNGSKYIINQLESIRTQTRSVDEVIMTDDGSNDGTIELVEEYIKKHNLENWKIIRNEKNLRFSKNFFKAVDYTHGDYVFLADQDDEWREDKVELMIAEFEKDSKLMALSSTCVIIDGEGNDISNLTNVPFPNMSDGKLVDHSYKELAFNSIIRGCTVCIRREVVEQNHNVEVGLYLGHDWFYNTVASILGKNKTLNVPVFRYRVHGENASLGRYNRKNALAVDRQKKIDTLQQIADAHRFLLNQYKFQMSQDDICFTNVMISFFDERVRMYENKSLYMFMKLVIRDFKYYVNIYGTKNAALHTILSDFMYAFNINFKII